MCVCVCARARARGLGSTYFFRPLIASYWQIWLFTFILIHMLFPSRLVGINVSLMELHPLMGPLVLPRMTDDWTCSIGRMITDTGEKKYSESWLSQCNFVHYTSLMDCPRIEPSDKPATYRLRYDVTYINHPFAHCPSPIVFGWYGYVTSGRRMECWEREKAQLLYSFSGFKGTQRFITIFTNAYQRTLS